MDGWAPNIQAASIHPSILLKMVAPARLQTFPVIPGLILIDEIYFSSFGIVDALGDQGCGVPSILTWVPLGVPGPRVDFQVQIIATFFRHCPWAILSHITTLVQSPHYFFRGKKKKKKCQMNIFICALEYF